MVPYFRARASSRIPGAADLILWPPAHLSGWQQVHYDYGGAFYEVQLYDTPKAGQSALPYLAETSKLFGGIACECMYRDGRESTEAPFATIAAIKHKLVQSGY